ncbi:MAG: two-component sensor histidine kinase, partial [bacterium]|nr:two-component sensor histidine kinase [bacterium]
MSVSLQQKLAIGEELRTALGPDAVVARSVNGRPGLWVGFSIDRDRYWLQTAPAHTGPLSGDTWLIWIGIALAATLMGSVAI